MYAFKKPIYTRGRIFTREILETMRDTEFDIPFAHYMEYSDGVIVPCSIKITENFLIIGKGLVKRGEMLYIMTESAEIQYYPTEELRVLKLKFLPQSESKDFILFETEIFLDENRNINIDEMEICRFKLKSGSKLRQNYVDFHDLDTEFDTLNILNVPFAGLPESTVSPFITRYFAKETYSLTVNMPFDNNFAALCLNSTRAISRELLTMYIKARLAIKKDYLTNTEIYSCLSAILGDIKRGIAVNGYNRQKRDRKIFVE
jgi:hypothetical protein